MLDLLMELLKIPLSFLQGIRIPWIIHFVIFGYLFYSFFTFFPPPPPPVKENPQLIRAEKNIRKLMIQIEKTRGLFEYQNANAVSKE